MLAAWSAASVTTLALDLLWVGVLARGYYRRELGHLMAEKVTWPPVLLFYILYGAGVAYFCAIPGAQAASMRRALLSGAFLGLVVYGTYDLTNSALLRDWGAVVSAVDIAWGVFLTATAAGAACAAARIFS